MNHSHILYDSDPHFKIDPISRKITNESSTKTTLIQHDHNSERFTFEVPRYVEGHDLSLCNVVEIHYLNVEANTKNVKAGIYTVEDLQIKADDETTVVCSWLVSHNATQFVGQLQFLVRFSCASEDTGKIEYVWNTAIYSSITISAGIYNTDAPSDNTVPPFNFVTTINGDILKFFVGTQAQYDALDNEDKEGLFAIISDDKTKEEIFAAIEGMKNGDVAVGKVNALNLGAPESNTEKKLTESGYYYISAKFYSSDRSVHSFGVVYWQTEQETSTAASSVFPTSGAAGCAKARIMGNGDIIIYDNLNTNVTSSCIIYTKKIGE